MASTATAADFYYDLSDRVRVGPPLSAENARLGIVDTVTDGFKLPPNQTYMLTFEYGGGVSVASAFYQFLYTNFYQWYDEYLGPGAGGDVSFTLFCHTASSPACFEQPAPGVLRAFIYAPYDRGVGNDCSAPDPGTSFHCKDIHRNGYSDFEFFFRLDSTTPDSSHQGWVECETCYARLSIVAVPEPATWALLIAGFGAAGAMLRRRRPAAQVDVGL